MAGSSDDDFKPPSAFEIIAAKFRKPATPAAAAATTPSATPPEPERILHGPERKAAMRTVDAVERKWSKAGLALAAVLAVVVPVVLISQHKTAKVGTHTSTSTGPDALLLGGAVLLFTVLGFVALLRGRRSLLAFSFFLIGFGLTLFIGLAGFAFIFLGAWLMLRAWRLQKYGTANMKMVAREAAARPSRKERQQAAKAPAKAPGGHSPPKANKRYTPKAPTKKKVPKPVD